MFFFLVFYLNSIVTASFGLASSPRYRPDQRVYQLRGEAQTIHRYIIMH